MNPMGGILLMIIGAVMFAAGLVLYTTSKQSEPVAESEVVKNEVLPTPSASSTATAYVAEVDTVIIEQTAIANESCPLPTALPVAKPATRSAKEQEEYAKKSGYDFEKFVVQKFDRKHFKVKEWAGDKYVEGIYAETTQHPDLLLELAAHDAKYLLSVECKWRKEFRNDFVEFANEAQLKRYQKFEEEKGIPVFVALGIGGTPSKPEQLYVIPLRFIKTTTLHKDQLERNQKDVATDFYYDGDKKSFR
jgi:hypothetical protein